ncbi:NfeD family protein [Paraburkholderia saeva]|uniref:NfeD family protein n=1 Tax=Paraburkholderia saeva TaxID=2777537 RepID=A0A9N8RXM8_9BURK|nr:NfeD family protein [Paraburkholderia saeva]CAG4892081.1 hypothetical protein R70241_01253 [Paraburkholderia saeva]CAG4899173.1 hypothetical protein R52603_02549 [Paraburkholderia saeva]CAG4899695.1 hypothetical protein LMG31841_02816 [Paraburkholderia saeva]
MATGGLFWWVGAGVLVVLELFSGTFYMLMIALGFVAAGLAHWSGLGLDSQLAIAALVAAAAVFVLRRSRFGRKKVRKDALRNPDVNLDIGETLSVSGWQDRRARTRYRGALWDVELAPGEPEDARLYEITALRGSCLIVAAKKQPVQA